MREIEVSEEPIELYKILKLDNMVDSGGEAKYVISEGQVIVNGKIETRKRKKIFSGVMVQLKFKQNHDLRVTLSTMGFGLKQCSTNFQMFSFCSRVK